MADDIKVFEAHEYRDEMNKLMEDQHIIWLAETISMFHPMRDIVLRWTIHTIPFDFMIQAFEQYTKMCGMFDSVNNAQTLGGPAKAVVRLVQVKAIKDAG